MSIRKIATYFFIIALVLSGISFASYFIYKIIDDQNKVLIVSLEDSNSENLNIQIFNMFPGKEEKRDIKVSTQRENTQLNTTFTFLNDDKSLLEYLDFKVVCADNVLYEGELENAKFSITFNNSIDLTFTYYMPIDVGNEAQGAKLDSIVKFEVEA